MMKICVVCNTEFEAKRSDAEVCSPACRLKNWRKKQDISVEHSTITPKSVPAEPEVPKTKLVVEKSGLKEQPSDESMIRIRSVMDRCNKDFGAGTVMFLGDNKY